MKHSRLMATLLHEFFVTLEDDNPLKDYITFHVEVFGIESAVLFLRERGYDV
tara:strand:+ start:479 stop:634 length:156 start_codon:yes stop_codon:yes gene_type:complete